MNKVALIGGMGPEAGVDALSRFLGACRLRIERSGRAVTDQAYPPHMVVQCPIPDRTAALLHDGPSPLPGLVGAMGTAMAFGARYVGIACNTAHFWHAELQRLFPEIDIVHMPHEAAKAVRARGAKRCAILGTAATLHGGLYSKALAEVGVDVLPQPEEDARRVHEGIFEIKGGDFEKGRALIQPRLSDLVQRADAVILGCTELGLIVDAHLYQEKVIDAADILADALAEKACGARGGP
ncbi:MAG: amino acid racemase [Pseudomonas sp.]